MQFSFWEKNTFIQKPDVVVVGSGIVGLFTAYFLRKKSPRLRVLVLERGMLPYGASTRNAGFACFGSPSELLEDLRNTGDGEVFALVEKRWRGLKKLRQVLGDASLVYEALGGYEIFTREDEMRFSECMQDLPRLNKQLKSITGEEDVYSLANDRIRTFKFGNVENMILNKLEGQVDTGRMMMALLEKAKTEGVEILNGVHVIRVAETDRGAEVFIGDPAPGPAATPEVIPAGKVIICTNGFAKDFYPDKDIRPARAQVLITSPIKNLPVKGSFHFDRGYYYFRNVGDRLLLGGGRNLEMEKEYTAQFGLTPVIQSRLEELLRNFILPSVDFTIETRWSGIMGLGSRKSPILQRTGNHIFCAIRLGGMGVAIGSITGEEAADRILQEL
jgi:glycine/D-amino acid oxidase-like deaminating enzyme